MTAARGEVGKVVIRAFGFAGGALLKKDVLAVHRADDEPVVADPAELGRGRGLGKQAVDPVGRDAPIEPDAELGSALLVERHSVPGESQRLPRFQVGGAPQRHALVVIEIRLARLVARAGRAGEVIPAGPIRTNVDVLE